MQKYAVLALAQIAVGAAAIFARFALGGAAPLAVAASRLLIASLLLLAVAALHARSQFILRSSNRRDAAIFIGAGIALAAHFAGWIWSLEYTSVAVSTLLVATTPVFTALYDSIAGKRPLTPLAWGALAVGLGGLVLVVGYSRGRPPVSGHALLGGILALAGAVAIGIYFLLVREVREAYGTRAIVTRTYTWAALALAIAAVAAKQQPPPLHDGAAWGGILAMALISQMLGHTALNASLRWFSPSAVAFTSLLEPVLAAALAFAIFGEQLGPAGIAGGVLILAAVAAFLREEAASKAERSTLEIGPIQ